MISNNTRLRNRLKRIVKDNPDVSDILHFGSAVRGKEKPADIDILVLFKDKIIKIVEIEIRDELRKYSNNISIVSKTEKAVLDKSFDARESVLFEAVSLISGENLASRYGYSSLGMFKYDFAGWSKLKKTKYYYALNGRGDNDGVMQMLDCIKLSDGIILCPLSNIEKMREFLDAWEIDYKYIPILIPERMNKKNILKS